MKSPREGKKRHRQRKDESQGGREGGKQENQKTPSRGGNETLRRLLRHGQGHANLHRDLSQSSASQRP